MATADIERQFATNFWGVVYLMRAVLADHAPATVGTRHEHQLGGGRGRAQAMRRLRSEQVRGRGLSLSWRRRSEQFGIKMRWSEPGFFRLASWMPASLGHERGEDYAAEGSAQAMWSPYHGTQPGDPDKLGDALVTIAGMKNPPTLFVAGADALATITPAVEARLQSTRRP